MCSVVSSRIPVIYESNEEYEDTSSSPKPVGNRRMSLEEVVMDIIGKDTNQSISLSNGNNININYLSSLPKRPSANVSWKNLEYSVSLGFRKGKKKLLHNLFGNVRTGRLTAIMGPSGAGKSTLLGILTGYLSKNVKGEVLVNENDRDLNDFRKVSCFIMQTDYLIEGLTVKESMKVAVNLKIPKGVSDSHKEKIITEIIEALNLTGEIDKRVKYLSGGQKKRLSIAQELVNNPSVMFLDEPTSGLDSSTCYRCMCLLKALALGGRTVVCTIHQPSSRIFYLFDDLYMISEGKCIYRGPVNDLVPFLAGQGLHCPSLWNPADFITEIACGEFGPLTNTLAALVSKKAILAGEMKSKGVINPAFEGDSPDIITDKPVKKRQFSRQDSMFISEKEIPLPPQRYATSNWNQLIVLCKRNFLADLRHPSFLSVRFLGHFVIGLVFGIVFFGIGDNGHYVFKNFLLIFVHMCVISFTGLLPTFFIIPDEMDVFKRENGNSWYSLKMYYLAKTFVEIPFQAIFPVIYCSLVYWMTGQPGEWWRFAYFTLFISLISLAGQSYAMMFVVSMSFKIALFIGPVSIIPALVFSGFLATKEFLPPFLHWIFNLSYFKYAVEGISLAIYGFNRTNLVCPEDKFCPITNPKIILKEIDLEHEDIHINIIAFIVIIVVFRILAFIAMNWRMRSR